MFNGKDKTKNFIFLFLVLAASTVFYFFYSQAASTMTFSQEESSITFSGPRNTNCSFSFSSITDISLDENPSYGISVEGGTLFGGNMYGIWKSDSLGTYQAYVTTKVTPCIIISDNEKTAVFNYSNAETTISLYEQLVEYWKSNS